MTPVRVSCIVEGRGETRAVPILVRRIAETIDPSIVVDTPVIRRPKSTLLQEGEFAREIEAAARLVRGRGAILVVIDSDNACPARLGPRLLEWARQVRGDLPIAVILAKWEFEAWFLAAAESLRGQRGLATDLQPPSDPEAVQGAKEWLTRHMPWAQPYSAPVDQPALARYFDLEAARRADSFDKCYREIERLLTTLNRTAG